MSNSDDIKFKELLSKNPIDLFFYIRGLHGTVLKNGDKVCELRNKENTVSQGLEDYLPFEIIEAGRYHSVETKLIIYLHRYNKYISAETSNNSIGYVSYEGWKVCKPVIQTVYEYVEEDNG